MKISFNPLDVLGMYEGASFWVSVFTELKNRGVENILIAVTDGLKGMTEALATVFPDTLHQTCIVHLIRKSMTFINWKDRWGRGNKSAEKYLPDSHS